MTSLLKHTVYINLDDRTDRRDHFIKEWAKMGTPQDWQPLRQPAVKMKQGALGCSLSHIKAIEKAKAEGWPHVLVCEDDVTFVDAPALLRSLTLSQLDPATQQWDVLLLGGNNWPPLDKVSEHCLHVHNCLSTMAYIVRQHYYDRLLANFREGAAQFVRHPEKGFLYSLDVYWRRLQIRDRWLFLLPPTVEQWRDNFSDIEGKSVTYSSLLLDPYKERAWLQPDMRAKIMAEMKMLERGHLSIS